MGSTSGSSAPAGYRFPREFIAVAVRWYLRYALSYRDVEELLAECGIEVDHVTVYRWGRHSRRRLAQPGLAINGCAGPVTHFRTELVVVHDLLPARGCGAC